MRIFLDMDGVIADFVGGALKVHGLPRNTLIHKYDIADCLGMTEDAFWKPINEQGVAFWTGLDKYRWTDDLIKLCTKFGEDVVIATTPTPHGECMDGKMKWLQKCLPSNFKYMMGNSKHLLADQDSVLIDDSEDQTFKFQSRGGQAILFPQSWNMNGYAEDRVKYIEEELWKRLTRKQK